MRGEWAPPWTAFAVGAIATLFFLVVVWFFSRPHTPVSHPCLSAPGVVRVWRSVSAHPGDGYVCGWHEASAMVPVFMCVPLTATGCP